MKTYYVQKKLFSLVLTLSTLGRAVLAAALFLGTSQAYSQSAIAWDVVSDIAEGPVAYGNGQFIAFGDSSSLNASGAFSSPTGEPGSWNWAGFGPDFGTPSAVTYANGLFLAVGYGIATSHDGTNWTTVYSLASPGQSTLSAVMYAHGLFVAVGGSPEEEGQGPTVMLTSSDGVNWTPRGPNLSGLLESVAYGNGVFVTVGLEWFTYDGMPDEGYADLTSSDGINWASHGDAVGPTLNGIAFGNGLFVEIMGNGILTSANGTINLKTVPYVGSGNFTGAAYGDGWFVAVGDSIVVSTNGTAWSSSSYDLPSSASFNSVAFLNGVFMAASDSGILRGRLNVPPQHAPPTILTPPQDQSANAGGSASFSVTASGSSPLSFQWQFNGTNLSGQTNATLTISYALPDDAGNYTVMVSNAYGTVTSSPPAVLDVQFSDYPTILQEPPSTRTLEVGGAVEFDVLAVGDIPLSYQWQFNGTNLPGETSTALILSNVNQLQSGSYAVIVSNDAGAVTNDGTFLTVFTLPQTLSAEYWPMYDGDVKSYTGAAGLSLVQFTADPDNGGFWMKVYLGDTNSAFETFGMNYDIDYQTVYDYSGKPEVGATLDFNPAWTWFDNHQLQNGGTINSSFVASVPDITNVDTTASVTVTSAGTVTVPAGTFSNCKNVAIAGHGAVIGSFSQSMVLAPGVGPIELGLYLPTPSGGTRFLGWESLTGGTVGGIDVRGLTERDITPPTLTITSPKPGQNVSNAAFTVTGTAHDNVAVSNVFYQFDGGSWMLATPGNTTWSNWTANVTLTTPGLNTVRAYAVDTSGNVSTNTNTVSFFYVVTAPLVVQTNGRGTVSPNYNGQSLANGSNYSMTATAATGFRFTNWTGGTNLPFSVLTNNARLSFPMESNLTLIANFVDIAPPTNTITFPTNNQRWSNNTITVTGTAMDNVQVSNVFYQFNGSGWMLATPSNSTWSNWTATLTPLQNTNLFEAYSVDTSGNKSPTNKVTFLYIPSATLTVQTNGLGGISPGDNGKLLAIGTNYTLTASAGHNWLFSNWVGGTTLPYRVLSLSSNYTFPMQSNLVLQANFVTNPFLAVAGVYNGLFYPTNGVTEASSGFITATIATNSAGAYTAKLLLDGGSNSFSGSFDLMGTVRTNLARSGKTPVSVTLSLDFNPADALMGGSVSNAAAGWNSVIQADRAVFSATADPATNYAGQFTLLLPPDTNAPVGSPGGYGYAAITNTLGGISTLGGALADGTPFLWSVPIARNGGVPLYQSLYSGKGSLLGWIYFTNEPPQNVSPNSSVSWIKPAVPNTLYPSGFANLTGVMGSPFTNLTKAGVPVLNLTSATLILTNGDLTNGLLIYTNIGTNLSSHNTLTNLDAGNPNLSPTNHLVIAINTNNGIVTVTFQATGMKTNTIAHGAVLQNQTNAAGYFLGTNQSGAFMLGNP